jgi:hypothetical protein
MFSTSSQNSLDNGVKLLLNILNEVFTLSCVFSFEESGKDEAQLLVRDGGSLRIRDYIVLKWPNTQSMPQILVIGF